ncbi:hypothetical protein ILYODFUR_016675 [Ilyodon furcidens]|uniref:Uncharacterized protein n=1 Tax=Ilyodon furcidens TaxID=33524 RepID=A0ABV0V5Z1_9TELE
MLKSCLFTHACILVNSEAFLLESSENSGSQLRPSQRPSAAQLYLCPPPHSAPKSVGCARGTHVHHSWPYFLGPRVKRPARASAAPNMDIITSASLTSSSDLNLESYIIFSHLLLLLSSLG